MTVLAGHLVRLEREDGLPRIVVRDLANGEEHAIAFDEEAYSLGLIDGYEFDTTTMRFTYSSMTTPAQVYDYDVATRARTLRKTQEVPSGHDPSRYMTRRLHGARPRRRDRAGVDPLPQRHAARRLGAALLYGYGAYGISIPASFATNSLSLVDRGFVYAIAHIRGGKDKGYAWYRDGKRAAEAQHLPRLHRRRPPSLIAEGFTREGRIVAQGGSAGGMLMGAVANMAPELFAGIIAEVPFVDVLDTMLDDTLPLTPPEWPEWGNPIASRADYDLIASYSPYDNVRAAGLSAPSWRSPASPIRASPTGSRRNGWRGCAPLKTAGTLVLLHTHMGAGHSGSPGRFDRLKEVALVYAFGLMVTGKA